MISGILVTVEILDQEEKPIASSGCLISVERGQELKVNKLMDACQRSVAHCIDELEQEITEKTS